MAEPHRKSARNHLLLIAFVFFAPLLAAAWLYDGGFLAGAQSRTNHGALYTGRHSRKMLGASMPRAACIFLHGETPPDTVLFAAEHPGLITIADASLAVLLDNKRSGELPAAGYCLIDLLGNRVLYCRPDIDPAATVDATKDLLRLSRNG